MATKNTIPHVDIRSDKQSIKTRTDRADVVTALAPSSALYQAQPLLKSAASDLATASAELAAAETATNNAEALLTAARGVRDAKTVAFDQAYAVFTSSAQRYADTPEDLQSLGLLVLDKAHYPLAAPLKVEVKFDPTDETIQIRVRPAPGMPACFIEINTDPANPATWTRLPGIAAYAVLSGYAPGRYWVRAACAKGKGQSEFTDPVSVTVK